MTRTFARPMNYAHLPVDAQTGDDKCVLAIVRAHAMLHKNKKS